MTKKELLELLEDVPDNGILMIQMGGHSGSSHPIIGVEDSTVVGLYEIRCDPHTDFWETL